MSYLDELSRELGAVGIRGRLRRRIVAETDDHLRSGGVPERFGAPREIAEPFAAELAPCVSRRSAYGAFAALAVAGGVYAAAFFSFSRPPPTADLLPFAVAVAAPQVAFVSGSLALLRALRRPGDVGVIGRRALVGVGSGLAADGLIRAVAEALACLGGFWALGRVIGLRR